MRKKYLVVANWKMKLSRRDLEDWLVKFTDLFQPHPQVKVGLAPSFTEIELVNSWRRQSSFQDVWLLAQDISRFPKGSYTGEVGGFQLKDYAVDGVIIGHSERRRYFNETDNKVLQKLQSAQEDGIKPVLAVSNLSQVTSLADSDPMVFAWTYEPIEAIGTGEAADPTTVKNFAQNLRGVVGSEALFMYGGSVSADNVAEYAKMDDVAGFLVGSSSLKPDSFVKLLEKLYEQI